jgi:alkaline phosphatase
MARPLAIKQGKATGSVTTARLTHATPAATYAHVCHRDAEYDISRQAVPGGAGFNSALGTGVDVLMGGVSYYWRPYNATSTPRGRPDGRDLVAELQAKGYTFVNDLPSLTAAPVASGTKLIGLYDQALSQGHMSYDLDRDPAKEPSLTQMTTKAIDILSKNSKGFFLMVEGGRIDHALHGSNAARALADTKAFDDAIQAAIDKVKTFDPELKDTLIVVTADHDHTMAFNGYGKRGTDILGLNINYATGTPSTDANGVNYTTLVFGNGSNRVDVRNNLDPAVVAGKDYLQEVAIRRGTPGSETHGGGDVMLFATGAGVASKTFKGTIDNTKVFSLVKSAAGY